MSRFYGYGSYGTGSYGRGSYGKGSYGKGSFGKGKYGNSSSSKSGFSDIIEYAKSGRAQCRGVGACGMKIADGALRYGKEEPSAYNDGTTTSWMHWGCVTPRILQSLKDKGVHKISGFSALRSEDRAKVQKAIRDGRVDPADSVTLPDRSQLVQQASTSQTQPPAQAEVPQQTQANSKKRKTRPEEAAPSAAASSSQSNVGGAPPATQIVAEQDFGDADQDAVDEQDEIYAAYASKVVGVQYYHGMVGAGELVSVVREPTNKYDSNSLRVLNAAGTQVGHIPRTVAARLSPLVDKNLISVEGVMMQGNLTGRFTYDLSITLNICGPREPAVRAQIEPHLIWATPGQRGFHTSAPENQTGVQGTSASPKKERGKGKALASQAAPSQPQAGPSAQPIMTAGQKAVELATMMAHMGTKVDEASRRTSVLDALCADDVLELPLCEDPPSKAKGNLKVDLLKHQSQGLRWCIEREYPQLPATEAQKPVQFWQLRMNGAQPYYYNIATKTPQAAAPVLGRGALMADSMGLGKTLTMLALVLATLNDAPTQYSNATLIVMPLSVLSNWTTQIEDHVVAGLLTTHVYHGDGRNISTAQLAKVDVVLTTYDMVSRDWAVKSGAAGGASKKRKTDGGLMEVKWKRVILDEGHNVRNVKTKTSQAVCSLEAERRWINSPNDLGSLLKFLRICTPLDQFDYFNRLLARPLTKGGAYGAEAAELLRAIMGSACLRRTKEMRDKDGNPLVPLPPVEVTVVKVALDEVERKLYDDVFAESQNRFRDFITAGGAQHPASVEVPMAANVLSMLTRLRQLALHPSLVPASYLEDLRRANAGAGMGGDHRTAHNLTEEEVDLLQQQLFRAIQDAEDCSICFDVLNNPRILPCAHYFCYDCIREVIARQQLCPMDRRPISEADLIEPAPPRVGESNDASDRDDSDDEMETAHETPSSSKVDHLISLLRLIPSTDKTLVFSQFTGFLDLIAKQLDKEGIPHVRFDGSMPQKQRAEVLRRFSVPVQSTKSLEDEVQVVQTRSSRSEGKSKAIPEDSKSESGAKNPQTLLISLKAGALGLNLTVANRVFLMDPWWQSAVELQAVDRVNRIGQTKDVHVYQMVAENTVEARVLDIQERKQLLVEQAFSGTRRTESARQKKEARLGDLVQLFGTTGAGS